MVIKGICIDILMCKLSFPPNFHDKCFPKGLPSISDLRMAQGMHVIDQNWCPENRLNIILASWPEKAVISYDKAVELIENVFGPRTLIEREEFFQKYTDRLKEEYWDLGQALRVLEEFFDDCAFGKEMGGIYLTATIRDLASIERRLTPEVIGASQAAYHLHSHGDQPFPKVLAEAGQRYSWLEVRDR